MSEWTKEEQKEHRKLWIEALRSGNYKQGKERLQTNGGAMCCLGVACDISGLGKWNNPYSNTEIYYSSYDGVYGYESSASSLISAVRNWLGLSDSGGGYKEFEYRDLVQLNDSMNFTFAQIADVIEREPEGLVV